VIGGGRHLKHFVPPFKQSRKTFSLRRKRLPHLIQTDSPQSAVRSDEARSPDPLRRAGAVDAGQIGEICQGLQLGLFAKGLGILKFPPTGIKRQVSHFEIPKVQQKRSRRRPDGVDGFLPTFVGNSVAGPLASDGASNAFPSQREASYHKISTLGEVPASGQDRIFAAHRPKDS